MVFVIISAWLALYDSDITSIVSLLFVKLLNLNNQLQRGVAAITDRLNVHEAVELK